jgi:hypothetical protein
MRPLVQKAAIEGLNGQKISVCPLSLGRNAGVIRDTRPQPHIAPKLAGDPVVHRSPFSAADSLKHAVSKLASS